MKKSFTLLSLLISLCLLMCFSISCQEQAEEEKPTLDINAEKQTIKDIVQKAFEAEQQKDLEATLSIYAENVIFQPPNMPQTEGLEALRNFYTEFFKMLVSIEGGTKEVFISKAGDMAWDYGWNRGVYESPEGRIEDEGKYLAVWQKIDGEWKCVAISFSSDKPAK